MPDYSALFQPMFWCRFSLIKHILFVFICFRFDKISNSWLTLKWVCQFMSIKSCPAVEVELQVVRLGSWFSTTLRIQLGPWASSWFLGCYYSSTLCIYLKKNTLKSYHHLLYLFIVAEACHSTVHAFRQEDNLQESVLSSTMWVPGNTFKLSGTFTHWAVLPVPRNYGNSLPTNHCFPHFQSLFVTPIVLGFIAVHSFTLLFFPFSLLHSLFFQHWVFRGKLGFAQKKCLTGG